VEISAAKKFIINQYSVTKKVELANLKKSIQTLIIGSSKSAFNNDLCKVFLCANRPLNK